MKKWGGKTRSTHALQRRVDELVFELLQDDRRNRFKVVFKAIDGDGFLGRAQVENSDLELLNCSHRHLHTNRLSDCSAASHGACKLGCELRLSEEFRSPDAEGRGYA